MCGHRYIEPVLHHDDIIEAPILIERYIARLSIRSHLMKVGLTQTRFLNHEFHNCRPLDGSDIANFLFCYYSFWHLISANTVSVIYNNKFSTSDQLNYKMEKKYMYSEKCLYLLKYFFKYLKNFMFAMPLIVSEQKLTTK